MTKEKFYKPELVQGPEKGHIETFYKPKLVQEAKKGHIESPSKLAGGRAKMAVLNFKVFNVSMRKTEISIDICRKT